MEHYPIFYGYTLTKRVKCLIGNFIVLSLARVTGFRVKTNLIFRFETELRSNRSSHQRPATLLKKRLRTDVFL